MQDAMQDTMQDAMQDTMQGAIQDTMQGAIQDAMQDAIEVHGPGTCPSLVARSNRSSLGGCTTRM